ncbi:MAG TPA: carotenoid oxygenase family protein, partial [Acidimicrobiales bacterium]|nr:carotenoid oxygenase family protein [Acidimicrobiales bacterium]
MATLTKNLFRGQGERDHALDVVEGHWPTDVEGAVYVVGPDKRAPEGHWFAEAGLVEKIRLVPDRRGRIGVQHRVIDTPLQRIKRRFGFLFRRVAFMELSPFGVTNLANTNIQSIDGRMFVGYDAGRPIEIDPETLRFITPVGSNAEWLQAAPGVFEPLCAVAAHPASDFEEQALYFVNYTQIAPPGVPKETWLARWALDGPVQRWRVEGMSAFDSIHDIKATEHHLVFSDLPFVVEPEMMRGQPRSRRIQEHTSLWIVAKEDLRRTPPGGAVRAVEVRLPMPT